MALEILESGAFPHRAGEISPLRPRSPSVMYTSYHLQSPAFTLPMGRPLLSKSVEADAFQALSFYIIIAHYSGRSGSKIVKCLAGPSVIPCRLENVTVFSGVFFDSSFHYLSLHHFSE